MPFRITNCKTPFKYVEGTVPKSYRCCKCNAHGVKLWRVYNAFLSCQTLFCAKCAGKHEKTKNVLQMLPNGKIPWFYRGQPMGWTDQIGSLIPAVPTEENDTFWGYTSVPQPGCEWWVKLPNNPPKVATRKARKTIPYREWERKYIRSDSFYTGDCLPVAGWNAAIRRTVNILKKYQMNDKLALKEIKALTYHQKSKV